MYAPPLFTTIRVKEEHYEDAKSDKWKQHHFLKQLWYKQGWRNEIQEDPSLRNVAVDNLCAAAVMRGADVFAVGVLACPKFFSAGEKFNLYGVVDGIASAFQSRDQIFSPNPSGTALKIDMLNRVFAIHPYPSFPHFAQNLPSMLPAIILDPKPKETILDMCAAPGGKTTHLLEILAKQTSDFSSIYACEKSKSRSKKLMENCKGHNMHIIVNDASKMDSLKDDNGPTVSFESYFDKILLDAPCSGTGQRPRKIVPIDDDRQISKQHIKVQQKLFKNAVKMLKSGGVLVYSTCSVQIEENHDIIDWALKNFDLNLQVPDIPFGVKSDQGILFNPFTTSTDSIDTDTIGFFVTKLIKK